MPWLTAVRPSGDVSRDQSEPPESDMSISAWPSMIPRTPRSAWVFAAPTSLGVRNRRNRTAMIAIMIGPPTNSAAVNCHDSSSAMITPSSITRLVDAISNAIDAVKSAPFRNTDRASATAA
jgi:hypothetical protein